MQYDFLKKYEQQRLVLQAFLIFFVLLNKVDRLKLKFSEFRILAIKIEQQRADVEECFIKEYLV